MKRIKKILFLLFVAILLITGISAGDYSFSIPKAQTTVEIEQNGSMTIFIEYEIENHGQKLDFIDIGLPSNNYTLNDVYVELNGAANSNIKVVKADPDETGLDYGVSLEMGSASIPSGGKAVVSVWIPNLRKNLYEATAETIDNETVDFVGFEFSPNYFNSRFVTGKTKYSFIIVFPTGVDDSYAYYYKPVKWAGEDEPQAWFDEDDCIVYEWYSENADMQTAYTFGGKFVKSALMSTVNIAASSANEPGQARHGVIDWETILGVLGCLGIPALMVFAVVKTFISERKNAKIRAGKYFPPQVKTDGEGIKRGLTAVEAAILLETDLERVISMILYGLAKKNVIQVKSMDPLDVEVADPLPDDLNEYEKDFIAAMLESNGNNRKDKMRDSMHRLILNVSKKIEGFSLKETREYYQSICEKAWSQVEAADTPELKSKLLGDNFGWAMLQEEPEKKLEQTFTGYDFYPPNWWWRVDPGYRRPVYGPSYHGPVSGGGSSSEKRSDSAPSSPTPMPVLPGAMFARSITDGARKLANTMVGNPDTFKTAMKNRTNPDPIRSSSSSSHRHGGGSSGGRSSCACACACDSCACACAGGGR